MSNASIGSFEVLVVLAATMLSALGLVIGLLWRRGALTAIFLAPPPLLLGVGMLVTPADAGSMLVVAAALYGVYLALAAVVLLTRRVVQPRPSEATVLTPCPDCGRGLSPRAATCPQCGRPM